ncbi:MAG: hypothetical protein Q9170_003085 [Blastenia crenularia]
MAPTQSRNPPIRSRASKTRSTASNPVRHTHPKAQSSFPNTKRDKRTIKRSALISRIEKSKPPTKKRRRPSKKLITGLESLAEALPAAGEAEPTETATAKIRHRSLKSKPGAMKRKEKIITMEKERFNQNMAQMLAWQGSNANGQDASHQASIGSEPNAGTKMAALRRFIQDTMKQRPAPVST